jgi:hypothetical protein
MQFLKLISLFFLASCTFAAGTTRADIIVTIDSQSIMEGTLGSTLDVWIRSSQSTTLSDVAFEFRIVPLGDTATQLRFVAPQNDLQLNDASYLFAAASLKRDGDPLVGLMPDAVGVVSTNQFEHDTFIGSDSATPSVLPGSVTLGTTNLLLARLELVAAPDLLAPVAGDSFRVELLTSQFTSFVNPNDELPVSFVWSGGTVHINAVPEPSGMVLVTLFFGGMFLRSRAVKPVGQH